jgi:hypothetical protein
MLHGVDSLGLLAMDNDSPAPHCKSLSMLEECKIALGHKRAHQIVLRTR